VGQSLPAPRAARAERRRPGRARAPGVHELRGVHRARSRDDGGPPSARSALLSAPSDRARPRGVRAILGAAARRARRGARPRVSGRVRSVSEEIVMRRIWCAVVVALLVAPAVARAEVSVQSFALPKGGGHPHDVAVDGEGIVWYTAQRDGKLGRLDPATGKVDLVPLGASAAPHGVIIGPDGAPWVTEGGTNAIVRVDPKTREVKSW